MVHADPLILTRGGFRGYAQNQIKSKNTAGFMVLTKLLFIPIKRPKTDAIGGGQQVFGNAVTTGS